MEKTREDTATLVVRIDERTKMIIEKMDHIVYREEFDAELKPLKAISYGLVSLVMVGVVGALMSLVFIK